MCELTVVRSYRRGYTNTNEYLDKHLREGYEVVMVTPFIKNGDTEYLEYILKKDRG